MSLAGLESQDIYTFVISSPLMVYWVWFCDEVELSHAWPLF